MNTTYTIHILNHNHNPDPLLGSLAKQVSRHTENIRIILWDDGSDRPFTTNFPELQSKYNKAYITWQLHKTNSGRASMRQKFLEHTKEGWIVSIDSDMVPDSDFINLMISSLRDTGTVYTGYHYYQNKPPASSYLLHWNYGRKREVPAQKKDPYLHFSTGIFAIHSSLAKDLYFDHSIKSYGHEDTLFGILLQEEEIPVHLTAMKALHQGLTTTDDFIEKQLESVRNLQVVLLKYPNYKNRLIRWGRKINNTPGLRQCLVGEKLKHFFFKMLRQNPNRLIYLDLIKLNEYLRNQSR